MNKLAHFLDQNPKFKIILIACLIALVMSAGYYFGFKSLENIEIEKYSQGKTIDSLNLANLNLQIRMTDMIPHPDTLEVRITTYSPTPGQCDDSPLLTATGAQIPVEYTQKDYTRLPVRLCAVSQDLLNYHLDYGDKIVITGPGIPGQYCGVEWEVRDRTSGRLRNTIDLCTPVGFPQGCWEGKVVVIKK